MTGVPSPGGRAPGPVRTLVAWCPDWPLVAAGIPPTVTAAAFHANRVVACTAAARGEGVKRGLRRREAQARCPNLIVEQHDPARDARAFDKVVAAVEAFTPWVEVSRPGTCALPTRGPSRYFGGDEALARAVREAVDAVLARLPGAGPAGDVRCRVGVADDPFAASLAARRDLVVPPGGSAAFLAPLPIGLLDEPELTGLLVRLGVITLGTFAALPAGDIVGRFGPVGAGAHRRARGLDDRDLDCRPPRRDLSVQVALEPPADRVDTAAFAAKAAAEELCGSLARAGLICTRIRIEAETEHGEHLARVWRHHRAFSPGAVAERVRWQLDGWLAEQARCGCPAGNCPGTDCPDPIGGTTGGLILLGLVPEEVGSDDGHQGGFWGGAAELDERAARGLARIQGILGPDAVMTAVVGGGRGPGEQVRLVPWGDPREVDRPGPPVLPPRTPGPARTPGPTGAPSAPDPTMGPSAPRAVGGPAQQVRRPSGRRKPAPAGPRPTRRAGTRVRTSGRSPSAGEQPVWPGRIPSPYPSIVPAVPPSAEVIDASGAPVGVTSRSLLTRVPNWLSVAGGPWEQITTWAGPWTADERWWDPGTHHRRARLQVVVSNGNAHLVTLEGGRWWIEASYD